MDLRCRYRRDRYIAQNRRACRARYISRLGFWFVHQCVNERMRTRYGSFGETPTMTLVQIAVVLIVVGVLMWLVNTYIPMMGAMKSLLNLVVIVVVVVASAVNTTSLPFEPPA